MALQLYEHQYFGISVLLNILRKKITRDYTGYGVLQTPIKKIIRGTTQQGIGMPDLNTQHPQIQQYAKDFYVYDESGKNVKEVASWPGVKMTSIGNDTYKYKLPDGWENAY